MAEVNHVSHFMDAVVHAAKNIDPVAMQAMIVRLVDLQQRRGRLFLLGVGGSAANCSHAANDFRKLCGIEAYCPTDNVAELTARVNDDGWDSFFVGWLRISRPTTKDMVLIMSVGGGDAERKVSVGLIKVMQACDNQGIRVLGIVGKPNGYVALKANEVVVVPMLDEKLVTPVSEALQAVIWHCFVSHPSLQIEATKW